MSAIAHTFGRQGRFLISHVVGTRYLCPLRCLPSTSQRRNLTVTERKSLHPAVWDSLGIWLDEPVVLPPQTAHSTRTLNFLSVPKIGHSSLTGKRKQNEDRYALSQLTEDVFLFAIFDGHGGDSAAEFCTRNFGNLIQKNLLQESDLASVLEKSFLQIDSYFLQNFSRAGEAEPLCSGTTATVALLRNQTELVVASVGDSPAILCREGKAECLTDDHSPRRKDERQSTNKADNRRRYKLYLRWSGLMSKEKSEPVSDTLGRFGISAREFWVLKANNQIMECGGFIAWNSAGDPYVNGKLAMTRSIGDLQVKPYGVIALPEIATVKVDHGTDSFLVLTTDGVSGIMGGQEMSDIVKKCPDPLEAAHIVNDQALQYGTQDNVTTLVIPFGAWGKYKNALRSSNFGRMMVDSCRWS